MEKQTLAVTIRGDHHQGHEEQAYNWDDLPRDVFVFILSRLGPLELLTRVQYVSRLWRDVCRDPQIWRRLCISNPDDAADEYHYLLGLIEWHLNPWDPESISRFADRLYRLAVDRSVDSLESITIHDVTSDNFLHHVADRSRGLKHLRLISCVCNTCSCYSGVKLTAEGMIAFAAKVPFLEELEFSHCDIPEEVIEAFGRCCPLLVSFKFVPWWCSRTPMVGRVIAHEMPRLVRLKLGGDLTSDGLHAILDGCPRLESLDLYNCCFIDLDGELGLRCRERIKEFRRPYDPAEDESEECCSGSCCNTLSQRARLPCYYQDCGCFIPPNMYYNLYDYIIWD